MENLQDYINEALINEAAPKFSKDKAGIESFCEYVFGDSENYEYVVNNDLTISVKINGGSPNVYMDTKDLKEIPDFIIFDNMDYRLGLTGSKLTEWVPRVKGNCRGIVLDREPKLKTLNLSDCEIVDGILAIDNTGIQSIIGAKGNNVQVQIKKNKNLTNIDIKNLKNVKDGSWISNNKKLHIDAKDLPKGIRVEKNAQNEKCYIS